MDNTHTNNLEGIANGTYHNHTTWSDGSLAPKELVERAIDLGFQEIGITDHYATLKGEINFVSTEELDEYLDTLDNLSKIYKDKIRILKGLEIDTSAYNPIRSKLPLDKLNRMDYVLFEYVDEDVGWIQQSPKAVADMITAKFVDQELKRGKKPSESAIKKVYDSWLNREPTYSLDKIISIKRDLTCAVGLAHPNMRRLISLYGAETLAKVLSATDIFIDACGSRRNSRDEDYDKDGIVRPFTLNIEGMGDEFKRAAEKYGVKFVSSSDTHRDNDLDALSATRNAQHTIDRYRLMNKKFS